MNNPKIALIGYGSMGKEIERLARIDNIEITDIFEIDNPINPQGNYNFDVAIDFSQPSAVLGNALALTRLKKNFVIGATGWFDNFKEIKQAVEAADLGMIYGSNFSVGMLIFSKLTALAANLLDSADGYDIMLNEIHHKRKKDSPSGTALSLGKIILDNYSKKKEIVSETLSDSISPESLHIGSLRGGEIAGTHTIYIDSLFDAIELTHRAKNRIGFANGALTAAKMIFNRKGVYEFSEIMNLIWNKNEK